MQQGSGKLTPEQIVQRQLTQRLRWGPGKLKRGPPAPADGGVRGGEGVQGRFRMFCGCFRAFKNVLGRFREFVVGCGAGKEGPPAPADGGVRGGEGPVRFGCVRDLVCWALLLHWVWLRVGCLGMSAFRRCARV